VLRRTIPYRKKPFLPKRPAVVTLQEDTEPVAEAKRHPPLPALALPPSAPIAVEPVSIEAPRKGPRKPAKYRRTLFIQRRLYPSRTPFVNNRRKPPKPAIPLRDRLPEPISKLIYGGNTLVKMGVLILFLGLAFPATL